MYSVYFVAALAQLAHTVAPSHCGEGAYPCVGYYAFYVPCTNSSDLI